MDFLCSFQETLIKLCILLITNGQDWEKDGELVREPFTIKTYLLWFWGVTYWRNRIVGIFRRARGVVIEPYINPSEYKKVILESRLHVFGYLIIFILSLYFNSWAALTFWILPMLITKPIHQMQNTIEHLGLTHKKTFFKTLVQLEQTF